MFDSSFFYVFFAKPLEAGHKFFDYSCIARNCKPDKWLFTIKEKPWENHDVLFSVKFFTELDGILNLLSKFVEFEDHCAIKSS